MLCKNVPLWPIESRHEGAADKPKLADVRDTKDEVPGIASSAAVASMSSSLLYLYSLY